MAKFTVEIADALIARFEAAVARLDARLDALPKLSEDGARQARAEAYRELATVTDQLGTALGDTPILRSVCVTAWARRDDQAARWAEHAQRRP